MNRVTRRLAIAVLAGLVSAGALTLPGRGAPERSALVTVRPLADSFVSSAGPRRNFGKARTLRVARSPRERAYLRFRLRQTGSVRRATLRIYVLGGRGSFKLALVPSSRWSERAITYRNAPIPGRAVSVTRAHRGWSQIDVTPLVQRSGLVTLALGASRGAIRFASRERGARAPRIVVDTASPGESVIAAAGNIACDPLSPSFNNGVGTATECHQRATSNLLVGAGLAGVLTLGDAQYACGGYAAYQQVFNPTWGRVKALVHPVLGNHDYRPGPLAGTDCDPAALPSGYLRYFGTAAGDPSRGYYSFDIGAWHLIALNTNCGEIGGCGPGTAQEVWLRADLAAHPSGCTLAYMHHPRFSSSWEQAGNTDLDAFWRDLYAARVELVLAAHDHVYERFAPQDPNGKPDPMGIREFVAGTGGFSHHPFFAVQPNSVVRNNTTFGVLKLTLRAGGYDWRFVPEAGAFTDAGSGSCR